MPELSRNTQGALEGARPVPAQALVARLSAFGHAGYLLAGMLLLVPISAEAKTLYVNGSTGNDSTSYAANGPSTPWRTIGRAAWGSTNREARNASEAARAGDTVLVAAGTYAVAGTNSRNEPAYYTENTGTPGNPITFLAEGTVNLTLSSARGSVIGAYRRDYIIWDGFTINEATAPSHSDTGPVTIWFCTGCVLQNLDINGNGDDNGRLDNHTGIRIEQSKNILIRNNRIQNVYTAHNVNNGAGVQVYSSGGVVFEHNEIFNCGSGIFLKGGPPTNNDYFTIRFNLIYNIGELERGTPAGNGVILHAGAPNRPEAPVRVYQNVIRNIREAGVKIWLFDGKDPTNNPMHVKIVNNTIDNCLYGLEVTHDPLPNSGHLFWNNVVTNTSDSAIAYGGSTSTLVKSRLDSEHNLFFSHGVFATAGGNHTFGSWKSTFRQDSASPASQNRSPQYANPAGQDYRLQPGSPARNAGVDVLDLDNDGSTSDPIHLGAYITGNEVIGRTTGAPSQPTRGDGLPPLPPHIR